MSLETIIRTLVATDIEGSTALVSRLGDQRSAELFLQHDRLVRGLLKDFEGEELDHTDGFLCAFLRPIQAVRFALALNKELFSFSERSGVSVRERVGVHMGEGTLVPDEGGTKKVDFAGIARIISVRVMSLAQPGQILVTRSAFDLARRAAVGNEAVPVRVHWRAHGPYALKGVDEPVEICEVGIEGESLLSPPPDSEKAKRAVAPGEEEVLGWRPAPDQPLPGRLHWKIERRLGSGGFGEAWLARHGKTGELRVFKFCFQSERLRGLKREVTLFRLLKETLSDRNDIARILDWNFDTAPYYIESEWTEGGDLIEWGDARGGMETVSLETRLDIVARVADALAAAHSVGVLHKDIKPSNILIRVDPGGTPHPRLTDFGIGLLADKSILAREGITVTGFTETIEEDTPGSQSGTRLYMAPELIEGKPPTLQSDVYSLGVVLYQMVTGQLSRALGVGWERDVDDPLLQSDIALCTDRDPAHRLADAASLAKRIRTLSARREAARREREEEKRREKAEQDARRAKREAEAERERLVRRRRLFTVGSVLGVSFTVVITLLALKAARARNQALREKARAETLAEEARRAGDIARTQKEHAEKAASELQEQLYRSSISLAQLAVDRKDLADALRYLLKTPPQLRRVEWGLLMNKSLGLVNSGLSLNRTRSRQLRDADFSEGGRIVLGIDPEGAIIGLDPFQFTPVSEIIEGTPKAQRISLPPGDKVLVELEGKKALLYDLRSWDLMATYTLRFPLDANQNFQEGERFGVTRSKGGILVEGFYERVGAGYSIHREEGGPEIARFTHQEWRAPASYLSPHGTYIAAPNGKTLRIISGITGDIVANLPTGYKGKGYDQYACVSFRPDEKEVAYGGQEGEVRVWPLPAGPMRVRFPVEDLPVSVLDLTENGYVVGAVGDTSGMGSDFALDLRAQALLWTRSYMNRRACSILMVADRVIQDCNSNLRVLGLKDGFEYCRFDAPAYLPVIQIYDGQRLIMTSAPANRFYAGSLSLEHLSGPAMQATSPMELPPGLFELVAQKILNRLHYRDEIRRYVEFHSFQMALNSVSVKVPGGEVNVVIRTLLNIPWETDYPAQSPTGYARIAMRIRAINSFAYWLYKNDQVTSDLMQLVSREYLDFRNSGVEWRWGRTSLESMVSDTLACLFEKLGDVTSQHLMERRAYAAALLAAPSYVPTFRKKLLALGDSHLPEPDPGLRFEVRADTTPPKPEIADWLDSVAPLPGWISVAANSGN